MYQKELIKSKKASIFSTRVMVSMALLSAISVILSNFEFPIPLAPPFIEFDFSDFPALLAAFIFHPVAGVIVELIKNAIGLLSTSTGGVGQLANFGVGAAMALSAGFIYRIKPSLNSALIGLLSGTAIMGAFACVLNYFVLFPLYAELFMPMDEVIGAFNKIFPVVQTQFDAILFSILPFNLVKGLIISAMTFFLYKKLKPIMLGKINIT
jgi:riboflavin transporter FmnP